MLPDCCVKKAKKVIVVVNKVDGVEEDSAMADFYSFGFDKVFAISSAHRRNTQKLLDKHLSKTLVQYYKDHTRDDEHKEGLRHGIHFSLIGRPNVGKSTLTNRMLGEERVVVFDSPGTTIDSVSVPFDRHGEKYTVIDTAGVRRRGKVKETLEKFSVIKTLKAIQESHVVVAVVDARDGISDQDISMIHFAVKHGRAIVVVVNKWDGMSDEDKTKVKSDIDRKLFFLIDYVDIHFISALHGTNVGHVFESIETAYDCANKKLTTADATKLLMLAIDAHSPPMVGKFRIKLKYAHVGGHNPPVIVIHGNQLSRLPQSYKKYLENFFRGALDYRGTPIFFEFKQSENPFATDKNKRKKDDFFKGKKNYRISKVIF